jgi:hypothetical protein
MLDIRFKELFFVIKKYCQNVEPEGWKVLLAILLQLEREREKKRLRITAVSHLPEQLIPCKI